MRYGFLSVIKSFADPDTKALFEGHRPRRLPPALYRSASRNLLVIQAASGPVDLTIPPGNRLEKLKGDRSGQYSIRINNQWRICFTWRDDDAYDVEVADYRS